MLLNHHTTAPPLYRQLAATLRQQIVDGNYSPGERLPSERTLMAQHGISRMTVRHALDQLRREGYVEVRHGKGAFAAWPRSAAEGLLGELFAREFPFAQATISRVLDQGAMSADEGVAQRLRLRPGEEIVRIRRVHYVNGEPAVLDVLCLPRHCAPRSLDEEITTCSLQELVSRNGGEHVHYAQQTLQATLASAFEVEALALSPPAPVARLHCTLYDITNRAVGYMQRVYCTDQCQLTFSGALA